MIKMIACDVDGTLVPQGVTTLPAETKDMIDRCHAAGILFVVASGREYPTLRRMFSAVADKVIFAANNGALAMAGGETLHKRAIPRQMAHDMMRSILDTPHCHVLATAQYTSYVPAGMPEYLYLMANGYGYTVTVAQDIFAIEDDILKISAWVDDKKPHEAAAIMNQKWKDTAPLLVAGDEWADFGLTGKEDALAHLMERYGVGPEELLVVGDNFNDEGMMRLAGTAYAMEDSDDYIKGLCAGTCRRVEDVVCPLLDEMEA